MQSTSAAPSAATTTAAAGAASGAMAASHSGGSSAGSNGGVGSGISSGSGSAEIGESLGEFPLFSSTGGGILASPADSSSALITGSGDGSGSGGVGGGYISAVDLSNVAHGGIAGGLGPHTHDYSGLYSAAGGSSLAGAGVGSSFGGSSLTGASSSSSLPATAATAPQGLGQQLQVTHHQNPLMLLGSAPTNLAASTHNNNTNNNTSTVAATATAPAAAAAASPSSTPSARGLLVVGTDPSASTGADTVLAVTAPLSVTAAGSAVVAGTGAGTGMFFPVRPPLSVAPLSVSAFTVASPTAAAATAAATASNATASGGSTAVGVSPLNTSLAAAAAAAVAAQSRSSSHSLPQSDAQTPLQLSRQPDLDVSQSPLATLATPLVAPASGPRLSATATGSSAGASAGFWLLNSLRYGHDSARTGSHTLTGSAHSHSVGSHSAGVSAGDRAAGSSGRENEPTHLNMHALTQTPTLKSGGSGSSRGGAFAASAGALGGAATSGDAAVSGGGASASANPSAGDGGAVSGRGGVFVLDNTTTNDDNDAAALSMRTPPHATAWIDVSTVSEPRRATADVPLSYAQQRQSQQDQLLQLSLQQEQPQHHGEQETQARTQTLSKTVNRPTLYAVQSMFAETLAQQQQQQKQKQQQQEQQKQDLPWQQQQQQQQQQQHQQQQPPQQQKAQPQPKDRVDLLRAESTDRELGQSSSAAALHPPGLAPARAFTLPHSQSHASHALLESHRVSATSAPLSATPSGLRLMLPTASPSPVAGTATGGGLDGSRGGAMPCLNAGSPASSTSTPTATAAVAQAGPLSPAAGAARRAHLSGPDTMPGVERRDAEGGGQSKGPDVASSQLTFVQQLFEQQQVQQQQQLFGVRSLQTPTGPVTVRVPPVNSALMAFTDQSNNMQTHAEAQPPSPQQLQSHQAAYANGYAPAFSGDLSVPKAVALMQQLTQLLSAMQQRQRELSQGGAAISNSNGATGASSKHNNGNGGRNSVSSQSQMRHSGSGNANANGNGHSRQTQQQGSGPASGGSQATHGQSFAATANGGGWNVSQLGRRSPTVTTGGTPLSVPDDHVIDTVMVNGEPVSFIRRVTPRDAPFTPTSATGNGNAMQTGNGSLYDNIDNTNNNNRGNSPNDGMMGANVVPVVGPGAGGPPGVGSLHVNVNASSVGSSGRSIAAVSVGSGFNESGPVVGGTGSITVSGGSQQLMLTPTQFTPALTITSSVITNGTASGTGATPPDATGSYSSPGTSGGTSVPVQSAAAASGGQWGAQHTGATPRPPPGLPGGGAPRPLNVRPPPVPAAAGGGNGSGSTPPLAPAGPLSPTSLNRTSIASPMANNNVNSHTGLHANVNINNQSNLSNGATTAVAMAATAGSVSTSQGSFRSSLRATGRSATGGSGLPALSATGSSHSIDGSSSSGAGGVGGAPQDAAVLNAATAHALIQVMGGAALTPELLSQLAWLVETLAPSGQAQGQTQQTLALQQIAGNPVSVVSSNGSSSAAGLTAGATNAGGNLQLFPSQSYSSSYSASASSALGNAAAALAAHAAGSSSGAGTGSGTGPAHGTGAGPGSGSGSGSGFGAGSAASFVDVLAMGRGPLTHNRSASISNISLGGYQQQQQQHQQQFAPGQPQHQQRPHGGPASVTGPSLNTSPNVPASTISGPRAAVGVADTPTPPSAGGASAGAALEHMLSQGDQQWAGRAISPPQALQLQLPATLSSYATGLRVTPPKSPSQPQSQPQQQLSQTQVLNSALLALQQQIRQNADAIQTALAQAAMQSNAPSSMTLQQQYQH